MVPPYNSAIARSAAASSSSVHSISSTSRTPTGAQAARLGVAFLRVVRGGRFAAIERVSLHNTLHITLHSRTSDTSLNVYSVLRARPVTELRHELRDRTRIRDGWLIEVPPVCLKVFPVFPKHVGEIHCRHFVETR